ncbi:hypothetical protein [Streptomyces sp. NPDC060188]|uniref:hypothetical protein n=1 Tax=Streptomyces sp. NPDC060188 TaxID=3347068 RepID=UPI0036474C64
MNKALRKRLVRPVEIMEIVELASFPALDRASYITDADFAVGGAASSRRSGVRHRLDR